MFFVSGSMEVIARLQSSSMVQKDQTWARRRKTRKKGKVKREVKRRTRSAVHILLKLRNLRFAILAEMLNNFYNFFIFRMPKTARRGT